MSFYYAAEYGVAWDKVTVYPRPNDCDFLTAPIGSKGCSYKSVATPYGRPVNEVTVAWEKY
jgi:hypothetical protein